MRHRFAHYSLTEPSGEKMRPLRSGVKVLCGVIRLYQKAKIR